MGGCYDPIVRASTLNGPCLDNVHCQDLPNTVCEINPFQVCGGCCCPIDPNGCIFVILFRIMNANACAPLEPDPWNVTPPLASFLAVPNLIRDSKRLA